MDDTTKNLMDTASVATVVGTFAGLLPAVAALFTIRLQHHSPVR